MYCNLALPVSLSTVMKLGFLKSSVLFATVYLIVKFTLAVLKERGTKGLWMVRPVTST